MASNVLPFFWDLASSSKTTRLDASANLVSSLQTFQSTYVSSKTNGSTEDDSDAEEDDEDDSDEESGEEVDASDDENDDAESDAEAKRLDKRLSKENAEDVVYSVKRLVRGLASSRESSRLGFAVALTELLSRIETVSATQVLSLLVRSTPYGVGMKGSDARDAMFARLFGISSIIQSGSLFAPSCSAATFELAIDELIQLGQAKAWLRESAWWGIHGAVGGLLDSSAPWKSEAIEAVVEKIYGDKAWNQEKVALTLLLEQKQPKLDWNSLLSPTFKHIPLLHSANLNVLGKLLKESDVDDEEEGIKVSESTGSWKPQLHFVWNSILDSYFTASSITPGSATFQDFFRVVVDESLFSNTSSSERKYWGFSVLSRALPLVEPAQLPLLFTPNVMRTWTNNLASSDRYLHQMSVNLAKQIQEAVKANPSVGFTLLSTLQGKGSVDFDRVTKSKTVEGILGSLNQEGVRDYIQYLQNMIVGGEDKNGSDASGLEERRRWALNQIHGLFKNTKVPKADAVIQSVLEFLLVHSFFVIKKVDKKSPVTALHSTPKSALSEATATLARTKFFACIVEATTASSTSKESATRVQGCDASGKLWLRRTIDTLVSLEQNTKHLELVLDADEEITKIRRETVNALSSLDKKVKSENKDIARGVEILLSFSLLQTYDESEDSLELLEEVNEAAQRMFNLSSGKASSSADEQHPPIDTLLDVLIALLDKGSADLRNLANMVVGMVASAFTPSSIEHLVAQLEQTAPETIQVGENDEIDDDDEVEDEEDDEEEDEEDEEDEEESDEEEDDEDDANLQVDPEFRRRVAEALQVSGMGIDGDDESKEDDEEESDEEVWDDEQMLKVDEQLAEVFRQRANAGKSKDFKNLHVQSVHFKTRILDFFEVLVRKQASNPVILHMILPLLRLVNKNATTEKDLSTKASLILRNRLGQAKEAPKSADATFAASIMAEIHSLAKRASTNDFSAICSACSLFLVRTLDKSPKTIEIYGSTLKDYMTKKSTDIRPAFLIDFIKRHHVIAFPLSKDLISYTNDENVAQNFRRVQAFTMLSIFAQHLAEIAAAVPKSQVESFTRDSVQAIYTTLEGLNETEEQWTKDRMREITKYAIALARSSAKVLGREAVLPSWDLIRLESVEKALKEGSKTSQLVGLQRDLTQIRTILTRSGKKEDKKKGGSKQKAEEDAMDVDEPVTTSAAKEEKKEKKSKKAEDASKVKKRKSVDGKEKEGKKSKTSTA